MALTLGLSVTNLADDWLDTLGSGTGAGTSFVKSGGIWVKLHTGIPGSAGTTSASTETTRKQINWLASSGGSKSMTGTLSWTSWSAGAQTISHISLWDASTGGNFLWSGALSSSKAVADGDTLNITSLTIAISPLAAD